jgi:hypothetical protein
VIDTDITFRKLEIFLEYMKRANIARTADALNISTVSVHRALHTLEEGIQCPLFTHKGRNLLPLPAANTLAEYAADILALMEKGGSESIEGWHHVFANLENRPAIDHGNEAATAGSGARFFNGIESGLVAETG